MRGAIAAFDGIEIMDLKAGETPFKISYDATKVELDKVLTALEKAGERTTVVN